jgi:uncharacterized protein
LQAKYVGNQAERVMIAARISLFALLVCWSFTAAADVAVPPLSGRVIDQTGTLSASDISSLTQRLEEFEKRKGSQLVVLIVPTSAPETIEQYSIRVAEVWKIGRKKIDDGVLLVVVKNSHKVRIEVGYGLEGALTDLTSKRIIDEVIVPRFQSGDFAGGISVGVEWIMAVIDGETLPAPQSQRTSQSSRPPQMPKQNMWRYLDNNPLSVVIVILVAATLYTVLGRLIGSVATGGLVGLLVWRLMGLWEPALIMAGLAFFFTYFAEEILWPGSARLFSRRGSNDGGGGNFGGGGGNFGGGGASGSW